MGALPLPAGNLNIDDAFPKCGTGQEFVDHAREACFVPRIADVDLVKAALQSVEVIEHEDRSLAEELEDLVDRVTELKPAIFHAEHALVRSGEPAVEVENVRHRYTAIAFTMTTVRSSSALRAHRATR